MTASTPQAPHKYPEPVSYTHLTNSLLARVNPLFGSDMDEFMDADYKWIEPLMQQLGLIS